MNSIYQNIVAAASKGTKLLAALIDPDKMKLNRLPDFMENVNRSKITHVFVGGSEVNEGNTARLVKEIKRLTVLPVVLFPGDISQITDEADALLFLSLISGRNPEYLIGMQVQAVSKLKKSDLEIIPTGYILIENGKETSVQRVTETLPLSREDLSVIRQTAKAGEYLGLKLIYLEAGSGAAHPIPGGIIQDVKEDLNIPLIVGGGIQNMDQLQKAFESGADLVVIGTAFEEDDSFLKALS